MVLNQMKQSWIKSVKLGSPEVKLGGPESNQVVLSQFGWSWFKSVGTELNKSVLSQIRWSWVKCGSPRSNQAVPGSNQSVLGQIG